MSFREFVEESKGLIKEAISSLGYFEPSDLQWDEPPMKELGDLSFRVGFQLAKKVGKKPSIIAEEIASKISASSAIRNYVKSAEGHESGFLNFQIKEEPFFSDVVSSASSKEEYGKLSIGKGQRAIVEHTSVNPSGALHIGHLRNVAIGDSAVRHNRR